ncbi:MAG: hypothetical protein LBV28_04570 [Puniceicoccales bacterium]|jgi:DNA-binding CsgD family transcriptional regulator|nr:hypothetical protein [Puniceicoccales bacterium]
MSSIQYTSYAEYENTLLDQARKDASEKWKAIESQQKLLNAYKEFGFSSTAEFVRALQRATEGKAPKRAGRRVRITPELAAKVKALKAEGKGATEISRILGISTPSVYKITKG